MSEKPYQALYIHVPFCTSRCSYCDFTTQAVERDDPAMQTYVEGLIGEILHHARARELAEVETIYLGGGTPTHLGSRLLTSLLYALSIYVPLADGGEFTMEANPESLSPAIVKDAFALGVNRLSLGVQSFDDEVLRFLGRAHDAERARGAFHIARERFENISLDLMCGIPGQSEASWEATLAQAIELGPDHISVYPLAVEEGTPLQVRIASGACAAVSDDRQGTDLERAETMLAQAGYVRYEISNYAKPGFESRHNRAYWTSLPYLGIGRAAVTMRESGSHRERVKDGVVVERLDAAQMAAEDLMLRMRLSEGATEEFLREKEALLPALPTVLDELCELGLIERDGRGVRPTHRGWLCGNEIFFRILALAP